MSWFLKSTEIIFFIVTLISGIRVSLILNEMQLVVPGSTAFVLSSLIGLTISLIYIKKNKEDIPSWLFIVKRTCFIVSFFLGYMFMATEFGAK